MSGNRLTGVCHSRRSRVLISDRPVTRVYVVMAGRHVPLVGEIIGPAISVSWPQILWRSQLFRQLLAMREA